MMKKLTPVSLLFVLALAACDETLDEARDRARLDEMRGQILGLIADSTCADSTDCRFMGLGRKPCGGPWEYVVYSVASVDSAQLVAQVAQYDEFNAELNVRYGWVSDCSVPSPPAVGCQDGRCVDLNAR